MPKYYYFVPYESVKMLFTLVAKFAYSEQEDLVVAEFDTNNPIELHRIVKWVLRNPFAGNIIFGRITGHDYTLTRFSIREVYIRYNSVLKYRLNKKVLLAL